MRSQLSGKISCFWHWKGKILCNFFVENCDKYCLRPEPNLEPETGPKLFPSRNRNCSKSLRLHSTGRSGSHYFWKWDPDPDHIRVKNWTRIHIKVKIRELPVSQTKPWVTGHKCSKRRHGGSQWRHGGHNGGMEAHNGDLGRFPSLWWGAGSGSGLQWKVGSGSAFLKSWIQFRIRKMMQKSTTLTARNTNLFLHSQQGCWPLCYSSAHLAANLTYL